MLPYLQSAPSHPALKRTGVQAAAVPDEEMVALVHPLQHMLLSLR